MATINVSGSNCSSFSGGTLMASTSNVGTTWDGNTVTTVVCRYKFTTDNYGATSLTFKTTRGYCDVRGNSSADDMIGRMRFAIGTNATQYSTTKSSSIGTAITSYQYGGSGTGFVSGSATINLLPNTTYYLWVFPNEQFASYVRFGIGNCAITTSGSYGQPSTITCSNVTLGNSATVSLSNTISGVKNTLKVYYGSTLVETLLDGSTTATSVSWTPTVATYAPKNTAGNTVVVTLKCTTSYNGTTWPGEKTKSVTLTIPQNADTKPTISSSSVQEVNTGEISGLDGYIQGYSKVQAAISASAKYSATISKYSVTVDGVTTDESSSPVISQAISSPGDDLNHELTVTLKVTDSRGFTNTTTETITVSPYRDPTFGNTASAVRCDSSGIPKDDGTYIKFTATGYVAELPDENSSMQNYQSMTATFRTISGTWQTAAFLKDTNDDNIDEVSSTVLGGSLITSNTVSANTTYIAKITITDRLGKESSETFTIPAQSWAIKFNTSGGEIKSCGIGKAPEDDDVLEIPSGWELRRGVGGSAENALFPSDLPTELVANDRRFKTYDSVSQLGLTSGSATIADAWSAMPEGSVLTAEEAQWAASQRPDTYGQIEIVKITSSRGFINWYNAGSTYAAYLMQVASNTPTGTWKKYVMPPYVADIKYKESSASSAFTVAAHSGLNADSKCTTPTTDSGYTLLFYGIMTSGDSDVIPVGMNSFWISNTSASTSSNVTVKKWILEVKIVS